MRHMIENVESVEKRRKVCRKVVRSVGYLVRISPFRTIKSKKVRLITGEDPEGN